MFPNPVAASAQIEGRLFPPGEYRVEVIAVDGSTALGRQVDVGADGDLTDWLDLADLATGFYMIRVYSIHAGAERLVGTYPIIKQR